MLCSLQWTLVCPFGIFVLLVCIEGVSAELHSQVGVCASRGEPPTANVDPVGQPKIFLFFAA